MEEEKGKRGKLGKLEESGRKRTDSEGTLYGYLAAGKKRDREEQKGEGEGRQEGEEAWAFRKSRKVGRSPEKGETEFKEMKKIVQGMKRELRDFILDMGKENGEVVRKEIRELKKEMEEREKKWKRKQEELLGKIETLAGKLAKVDELQEKVISIERSLKGEDGEGRDKEGGMGTEMEQRLKRLEWREERKEREERRNNIMLRPYPYLPINSI